MNARLTTAETAAALIKGLHQPHLITDQRGLEPRTSEPISRQERR